jgi:uncharacterized membrane-anchored protein YitT (DUF2179 family)
LSSITGIAINKDKRSSVDMPYFFVNIFIASIGLFSSFASPSLVITIILMISDNIE